MPDFILNVADSWSIWVTLVPSYSTAQSEDRQPVGRTFVPASVAVLAVRVAGLPSSPTTESPALTSTATRDASPSLMLGSFSRVMGWYAKVLLSIGPS